MKERIKYKVAIFIIVINTIIFFLMEAEKEKKINFELEKSLSKLEIHFNLVKEHFKDSADLVFFSTMKLYPQVKTILKEASQNDSNKTKLRNQLYSILKTKFSIFKSQQKVVRLQFILPDGTIFLKMHNPKVFGGKNFCRQDIAFVNQNHQYISNFIADACSYNFRSLYPIFDKDNNYLGLLEVGFSTKDFQEYLTEVSKLHIHLLIKKNYLTQQYKNYCESAENPNFFLMLTNHHTKQKCVIENKKKLETISADILFKMKKGKKFILYKRDNKKINIISFLPIYDFSNKYIVGWLVLYEKNKLLFKIIQECKITQIVILTMMFILGFFIYKN